MFNKVSTEKHVKYSPLGEYPNEIDEKSPPKYKSTLLGYSPLGEYPNEIDEKSPPKYKSTLSLNDNIKKEGKSFFRRKKKYIDDIKKEKVILEEQIRSLKSVLLALNAQKQEINNENEDKKKENHMLSKEILFKKEQLDSTKSEISKNRDKLNELEQYKDLTSKLVDAQTNMDNIKDFLEKTKDENAKKTKLLAENIKLSQKNDSLKKTETEHNKNIDKLKNIIRSLRQEYTLMNNFIEENKALYEYMFTPKKTSKKHDIFAIYNDVVLQYEQGIITLINERILSLLPTANTCKNISHNELLDSYPYHNYMPILSFDIRDIQLLNLRLKFGANEYYRQLNNFGRLPWDLDIDVNGKKFFTSIHTSIFSDRSKFSDDKSFDVDLNAFKSDENINLTKRRISLHYLFNILSSYIKNNYTDDYSLKLNMNIMTVSHGTIYISKNNYIM